MFSRKAARENGGASRILHPALIIVIFGLAVRFILAPILTYDFDVYHWGVIIENIQSGNELYSVAGYYYTPVWGYMLGFISAVGEVVFNVDIFGEQFTTMLPIEDLICRFHTAVITCPEFNFLLKVPIILCDAAVAAILYWLVKDRTRNERKATATVALWILCPTVIYMSGIQVMFDSFSALMMLVTVILVYKDKTLLGGMMFAVATLLKFFPAFCIIVLVGYVYTRHRNDGLALNKILQAVTGAIIMAAIIMAPQILDGTILDTLSFVTGRVEGSENLINSIVNYCTMICMVVSMTVFGLRMFRTRENIDDAFFRYILLAFAVAMVLSVTPQYMIVFLPFLILQLVSTEGKLRISWILISVGSFVAAFSLNNLSLLTSSSMFLGIISPEWILGTMQSLESITILGFDLPSFLCGTGNMIEAIGILSIPFIMYRDPISKKSPILGKYLSKLGEWKIE